MDPLRPGDPKRIGPYQVIARIGSGGMGTVFLAERGTQQVAVKFMLPMPGDVKKEAAFRFHSEAQTLLSIKSDFVAPIFEWQFNEEPFWFSTEYVAGPNLEAEVNANGPLDAQSLHYLIDCCNEGLRALHNLGIVHQDFKPANIMLSDGGPKIIDLGLAQNIDTAQLFEEGQTIGTPAYVSPEQILGKQGTRESDYFSLGVTIYQAAVGQIPWRLPSFSQLKKAILNCKFELPENLDPLVAQIVKGLLVVDPESRLTYEEIRNLINSGRAEPLHRSRIDLQRMDQPGQFSREISEFSISAEELLSDRPQPPDLSQNPLINPTKKTGLDEVGTSNLLGKPTPLQDEHSEETGEFSHFTSKRFFDHNAIPVTPSRAFLAGQINPGTGDSNPLIIFPDAPKKSDLKNWYEVKKFSSAEDVYSFINLQFQLYGINEPHAYYEMASREIDRPLYETLISASEQLASLGGDSNIPIAMYWIAYFAIELANVSQEEYLVTQLVLLNVINNLSVASQLNPRQEDARYWLNTLYNADGHNPGDMAFAESIYQGCENVPTEEMEIELLRLSAMNGLPNALGSLTWLYLCSNRIKEGHDAFVEIFPHLGSEYSVFSAGFKTFDQEVANAQSNDAFCRLALGRDVEAALQTLDDCVSRGADDGAFARAVMELRSGNQQKAIDMVKQLDEGLKVSISMWPEVKDESVGWFQDFADDVIKLGKLVGL